MEGCSNLGDDSLLHQVENGKRKVGLGFDLDFPIEECRFDKCKERLRSLFDQLLVAFMREKSVSKCIRPLPVLCSDGREIDLFKLFWVAWKIGGYDAISQKDLWSFVIKEFGLSCKLIPWLKLIYIKYLNEFDQWLREDKENDVVKKLDLLSQELKTTFSLCFEVDDNMMTISAKKIVENAIEKVHKSGDNDDKKISFIENSDIRASAKKVVEKVICNMQDLSCKITEDGGRFGIQNDRDTAFDCRKRKRESQCVSELLNWLIHVAKRSDDPAIGKIPESSMWKNHVLLVREMRLVRRHGDINTEEFCQQDLSCNITEDVGRFITQNDRDTVMSTEIAFDSLKRKRESKSPLEMLNWLIYVAKHSNDPAVGKIPEFSKRKDRGREELWVQALQVREMLSIRRDGDINTDESVPQDQQKKLGMHPSMYEYENLDRQAPQKLRCSKRAKPLLCSCCNAPAVTNTKVASSQKAGVENNANESVAQDSQDPKSSDVPAEKPVPVGPHFQAQVPEWTGSTLASDSKWLGTTMWAPQDDISRYTIPESDSTTKCYCRLPNSVECVRFHIAERRFKLKRELGLLFYRWQFDRMGEEVSLSWTEEEEKRFNDNLWNNASRFLPTKSHEKLVSYYFNVFVVRRRSYQNRVTPKDIDSDDDEKECGTIGSSFGYQAVTVSGWKSPKCIENKESTDFL